MDLVFVYVLWNPSPQATSAAEQGQRGKMPPISASQIVPSSPCRSHGIRIKRDTFITQTRRAAGTKDQIYQRSFTCSTPGPRSHNFCAPRQGPSRSEASRVPTRSGTTVRQRFTRAHKSTNNIIRCLRAPPQRTPCQHTSGDITTCLMSSRTRRRSSFVMRILDSPQAIPVYTHVGVLCTESEVLATLICE